jgi:soluble lytic murein transglycosylase-like protein
MMKLSIDGHAAMFVPIRQVDRVIDDSVPSGELEAALAKVVYEKRAGSPLRSWRYSASVGPIFRSKFDTLIREAARKFDVDAALVSAVIKAESDFNPREVSKKGARGLMQMMPATAARFGVADSFDPGANINGGTRYLRWLLGQFHGDVDLALAAYNAGEANVWKYNGIPPFRETVIYVNRIATHLRRAFGGTSDARLR